MLALAVHDRAVRVGKLAVVVIINFTSVFTDTLGASADTDCFDWMLTHKPVTDVDVVNVLLANMITAKPVEIIPVAHLILHFGHPHLTLTRPNAAA